MMSPLETPRLHLRPMGAEDYPLYRHLYTDAAVMRHIGQPLSTEAARASFAKSCRNNLDAEFNYRLWVMSRKSDGADIGLLGLVRHGDHGEIGAMLKEAAQGHGFAAESIAALIDYAFMALDVRGLFTRHDAAHGLAAGLMSKLAFVRSPSADGVEEACRWQLSRTQWEAATGQVAQRT
jgi:[ribosomal protein S5]-alanine N-acetyltransferase